jgi:hypothetical protein
VLFFYALTKLIRADQQSRAACMVREVAEHATHAQLEKQLIFCFLVTLETNGFYGT